MWKRKLLIQSVICIVIAGGYITIQHIDSPVLQKKTENAVAAISKHYTISDIADKGTAAVMNIIKAPAVVTSRIIESQETRKYGAPVDEIVSGETGPVYAAAGGRVIETGSNDDIGLYVKISHDSAISTYGNCDRLYVKENEHVRKGQVIGCFTNDGSDEFYYDLKRSEDKKR